MRIFFIAFVCTLCSVICFGQQNPDAGRLVKEGIALSEQEEYDAAIKKFDEALQFDSNDYEANYQKSVSCLAAKRYDECIIISKYLIEKHSNNPAIKAVYSNYGSAEDDKGAPEEAIKIYDKGIQLFPVDYFLYFNKGLTLSRLKKWDDANSCFLAAMKNKPGHAGSLYFTALIQEKSNRVAALMSGLAFLAAEPEGKRAATIYNYIFELMNSFAAKDKKGKSSSAVNSGNTRNKEKENNFSKVQSAMGLAAASALKDSVKVKADVDKLILYMQALTNSLAVNQKEGKGIYWKTYAPFFIEMKRKGLVNAFAHIASITAGNDANIKWINDHQDELKQFYEWYNGYKWVQ